MEMYKLPAYRGEYTAYTPVHKVSDPDNMKVKLYEPSKPIKIGDISPPKPYTISSKPDFHHHTYKKPADYVYKEYVPPWMKDLPKRPPRVPQPPKPKPEKTKADKPTKPNKPTKPTVTFKGENNVNTPGDKMEGAVQTSATASILRTINLFRI